MLVTLGCTDYDYLFISRCTYSLCSILPICSTLFVQVLAFSCPSSSHCGSLVEAEGAVVEGAQWNRFSRVGKQVRVLSERRLRKGACWVSWAPDWGPSLSGTACAQQGPAFQQELWWVPKGHFHEEGPTQLPLGLRQISHRINNSSIKMGRQQEDSLVPD